MKAKYRYAVFPSSNSKIHQPINITADKSDVFIFNKGVNYYSGSSSADASADSRSDSHAQKRKQDTETDEFLDDSIWKLCLGFMKSDRKKQFHQHSPANHGIVQCGYGISPRPTWPQDIYKKLPSSHITPAFPIPAQCTNYIDGVIDCILVIFAACYGNGSLDTHDRMILLF
ncbi:unnamed protein product [Absidia cylindrospora]